MHKEKSVKNPEIYGIYCGILILIIGFFWLIASLLFIKIGSFGLGQITLILPITGIITLMIGAFIFFRALASVKKDGLYLKKNDSNDHKLHIKHHYKGIIFDLDGTLLDTIDDLAKAGNAVLQDLGFKPQERAYFEQYLGNGIYNLVSKIIPKPLSEIELNNAYQKFLNYYSQCYNIDTKPYPGVIDTVNKLEKMGYLLAVVSNKKEEYLKELIKFHFPNNQFVCILGEKDNQPKKPNRVLAEEVAQKMMIDTNNLVMVGDSEVDVNFAKNANMLSVVVTYGFRSYKQLIKTDPDYLIDEMDSLVDVVIEENSKDNLREE